MDQRGKVRIGTEKVIEMKQGSLEMRMGCRVVKVGVLVWGCTECNTTPPQHQIYTHIFSSNISPLLLILSLYFFENLLFYFTTKNSPDPHISSFCFQHMRN